MTVLAVITLAYSLATRYELGLFRLLSMRGHLALDFLSGALLCVVALVFSDEPDSVRGVLAVLGLFEIAASLMTEPEPSPAAATPQGAAPGTRARGT